MMKLDKQRKLVLMLIIIGVIIIGFSIYLGINNKIDRFIKDPVVVSFSAGDEAVELGYSIDYRGDKMIFYNIDYGYRISLPADWPLPEVTNLSEIPFIYLGEQVDEVVIGGMVVNISMQPADTQMSINENINSLYDQVDTYEELVINNQTAILVDNLVNGINKTVFFMDQLEEVMIVVVGHDLDNSDQSTFADTFSEIINSFQLI